MRRRALIGALASALLLGGCAAAALPMMWMAAYEAEKGQTGPTTILQPSVNDPVLDGRVYRNDRGTVLQVKDVNSKTLFFLVPDHKKRDAAALIEMGIKLVKNF